MTLGMKPTAYDGRVWSDFNCAGGFALGPQAGPSVNAIELPRAGQDPLNAGSVKGLRTITLDFTVLEGSTSAEDVGYGIQRLLGHLQPGNPDERLLIVRLTDGPDGPTTPGGDDGLELEIPAMCGTWRYNAYNGVLVDFVVRGNWRRRTNRETTVMPFNLAAAMPLVNRAPGVAFPTLKLKQSVARTTHAAAVGWDLLKIHTVTNNTTRNWWSVPYTLDIGDHAALVSGSKSQSDGDDLRIVANGKMLNRSLTNVNTKRTFAHIEIDVPAGESLTLEVWYGNPSATAPDDLSTRTDTEPTYRADDLEGTAGTSTSAGANTMTDSGAAWETNRWAGGYVQVVSGTGAGQRRQIASNTGTQITVTRNWSTQPSASGYVIWMSGIAVGGGIVTTNGTTTSLTDASQAWGVNEWKDGYVYNITQGIGPYRILSNTATVLTTATMGGAPATSDSYYIERFGVLNYMVNKSVYNTAHRGLWRLNKYFNKGGRVAYGDQTPAGWTPYLMLPNNDDKAQGRFINEGSGGGHDINNWPSLYARRSVRSANTWPEKGQADGVAFFDPRGIIGFRWDYRLKNEGGIGIVEVRTQEPGGSDWQTVASDSQTQATLTAITSSGATGYSDVSSDSEPVSLWVGVLPLDGVVIPSTERKDRSIEVRANTIWKVLLDISGIGGLTNGVPALGSETAMWDAQPALRLGGGTDEEPPFQLVQIGGANHYTAITGSDELWINAQPDATTPLFGAYLLNALQDHLPYAGTIYRYEQDTDGATIAQVAGELLPLHQLVNMMGTSADTGTGWTKTDGAGVTSSLSTDTGEDYDGNGQSLKVDVTVAPAGPWTITLQKTTPIPVVPGELYEWAFVSKRVGLTSAVEVEMTMGWGDGVTTNGEDLDQTAARTLATNDQWYSNGGGRKVYAGPPTGDDVVSVYGATIEAWPLITISGSGATTGAVNLEVYLTTNGLNLYVDEEEIGTITVEAAWRESYVG